jgi:hypothetical protein
VAVKIIGPYEYLIQLKGAWYDVTVTKDDQDKVCVYMIGNKIHVQEVDLSGIQRGGILLVGTVYANNGFRHNESTERSWVKPKGKDGKAPVFTTTADPTYQALLAPINAGKQALEVKPAMDMPGAVAVPQIRDFGRSF